MSADKRLLIANRKLAMHLKFTAGQFEIETFTDGYPNWMELKYAGQSLHHRFHHKELADLAYVIERMRRAARAEMSDNYKSDYAER